MDQSFFETPVKGKKQGHKKNYIKDIHSVCVKRHKLTEFFGNSTMFFFGIAQKNLIFSY